MPSTTVFVGIDIGKRHHAVAVLDAQKRHLLKLPGLTNTHEAYQALANTLLDLARAHRASQVLIGMEATGNYWQNLFHFLRRVDPSFRLVVLNPEQTHAFARSELRRSKTDPLDASGIARFLIERRPQPTWTPPVIVSTLRDLDHYLHTLSRERVRLINRLRAELAHVAPEIEATAPTGLSLQLLALLRTFPTAEIIRRTSTQTLSQIRRGRAKSRLPAPFVAKVKALSTNSLAYKTGPGSHLVVQSLARLITTIQTEEDRLTKELFRLYSLWRGSNSILTTIKGISQRTAIALELHIGDVQRFPNARTFVAYLGLNPAIRQSGSSLSVHGHIQKKGAPRLRQRLYMVVLAIVATREGPIWHFYDRLVQRGKPKPVALVAAMRKLAVLSYAMLKHQQPYDPTRF